MIVEPEHKGSRGTVYHGEVVGGLRTRSELRCVGRRGAQQEGLEARGQDFGFYSE